MIDHKQHYISVNGLSLYRGERPVLRDFSTDLDGGEALVIRGANGSGKTSLLRALSGLLPYDGQISICGIDLAKDRAAALETIIYHGHRHGLTERLSGFENISYWARSLGLAADAAVLEAGLEAAFDDFGLLPLMDRDIRHLSEGQRQRCGLVKLSVALRLSGKQNNMMRPIWYLDEPLAALDDTAAAQLLAVIDAHTKQGGSAIITTHQPMKIKRSRILSLDANDRGHNA